MRRIRTLFAAFALLSIWHTASAQSLAPRVWLAGRFDSSRVIIYFDTLQYHESVPQTAESIALPRAGRFLIPRILPEHFVSALQQQQPTFERFAVGDRHQLLTGHGHVVVATVTAPAAFEGDEQVANESYPRALASVADADLRWLVADYYAARRFQPRTPTVSRPTPAAGLRTEPIAPSERDRIVALLHAASARDTSADVRADERSLPLAVKSIREFAIAEGAWRYYVTAQLKRDDTHCTTVAPD